MGREATLYLLERGVRVTGTDLDRIERYRYDPEKRTMQVMTPVA